MRIFDSIFISSIKHLPKWFARPFAAPYVAGETENDVVKHIKQINNKGMSATADILGEHTQSIH